MEKRAKVLIWLETLLIVALCGFMVYGYTLLTDVRAQNASLTAELAATNATLSDRIEEVKNLGATIEEIRQAFAISEENGAELLALLKQEKGRNTEFEDQINGITGTVGKLDRLSKTDPQLLQKYSKVFFLNEHYMPGLVSPVDTKYVANKDTKEFVHREVAPFLDDLLKDAQDNDIDLQIVSAYRSFDEQRDLKSAYTVQYGTGANTFSADQGYSEHQLGTTVDFAVKETSDQLTGFENTEAYAWLQKNAHKYGFTLSYPEGNSYYVFEPWHWRFVGVELATDLYKDGQHFYDLDQRKIDEYLISLFD